MKPIALVLALGALLAAQDAGAAAIHARTAPHRAMRVHQVRHLRHRPRIRLYANAASLRAPARAAGAASYRPSADETGASTRPGFFKSSADHEAGWGFHRGGMKTVVGLYQRPAEAGDIPGPQIYHTPESRGAAGLSLSFKLGR